jgi:hypothetical protein
VDPATWDEIIAAGAKLKVQREVIEELAAGG